jgi:trigger factor
MKIQVDSISDVKKKISVQIPEERIQQEVNTALDDAQKKVALPGFRPGKAPRAMLEKKYGKALEAEVCQDLVRSSMNQAIQENQLDAITVSDVSEPKREIGKGFSYTASIEVRPSIEPKKIHRHFHQRRRCKN